MGDRIKLIEEKALRNEALSREEARFILETPDSMTMDLVAAAKRVREKIFGNRVKLNYLVNVKSGICPEDCAYCSQSKDSGAPIDKYPLMPAGEMISHVERGLSFGATRACLVASGRGPGTKELESFCSSVQALKEKHPGLEVCACLGLLKDGQAEDLKSAGVFAYNHNINTSESFYEKICVTHSYNDRLDTIEKARCQGLSSCSGVLAGMGESNEDLVEMAFVLRDQRAESIPVNFLVAVDQTPLAGTHHLTPQICLKILALFRFVNPAVELRMAGGREVHLRHLQPLGLMIANSMFIGDYLTTQGQSPRQDLEMIRDLGYVVQGQPADLIDKILGEPLPTAPLKSSTPTPVGV